MHHSIDKTITPEFLEITLTQPNDQGDAVFTVSFPTTSKG
jgi:hypothetical protein